MSNIFKRLRLIGRREEREEMNRDGEAHLQNDSGISATENAPEQNPSNARGDFRHHRPRCRRSARKRLRFPSKHESEPALSCRKIAEEEIPHASHPDASRDDTESCDAVLLKDNVTDNETGGTEGRDCSTDGIDSKTTTKGEDDLNESFEVLMPDLLSSNGDDLSTKKITQECNEATPDPPVLHRMDTVQGIPSVRKDTSPGLISVSKEDVNVSIKSPVTRAQARKEDFHLLKLLCSDEDTIQNDSLPLLSLSKEKRRQQAFTLGKEVGHASLKVKDMQGESCSKKNFVMIERNDLNTPLGESNLNASNISLTLSRTSSRRKQEFNKIKECNDQGATVLESHKDVNKDFARIDEEQGSGSNKENIEGVKVKQCNDQGATVLESHKEVNKDISRIDGEKVRSASNKENNENAKDKQCNEKGATVQESHKDLNKDFAKIDEKIFSWSNKENNENVKNTECNNEEMMVPELKSQRVSEYYNKDIARNNVEQQGSESNKENTAYVKVKECNDEEVLVPELKSQRVGKILSKEENKNSNDIIDFQNQSLKPTESTEAWIKSDEQDFKCSQSDTKLSAGIQETQSYKGNHKEITICQKQLELTESTKIEDRPERGDCESRESKELEGEGIDRLQSKKVNSHAEGTEEASKQEKREPIKSTKTNEGCKEEDIKSSDSSAIPVESVEVIQYQEETNDKDPMKDLNGHKSAESTGDVFIGVKQSQQEKEHHHSEPNCQENTEPTNSMNVETRSAKGRKELREPRKEGNVDGVQFSESDSVEATKLSKDQPITQTTEPPKLENRSGEGGSRENCFDEKQVGSYDGVRQQSREPDGLKNTEPVKSTDVKNCLNREATFRYQPFKLTHPQDAKITTDLSPTITPRKMYEMFAAPNSQGNFNGSLPMADSAISQVPRKRGRPRKMKTEKQPKVKSVNRNNAYNMQMNNLEWSRMVSAPGSLHSQGDGMFMLANAMLQGQPQELNVAGGYYTNLLSSSEEMPFKSTDDIEGARAASSSSGMDSQGTSQLEKDPSGNKATKEGDDGSGKVPNYSTQFNPVVQPYFDGLYMIDSAGGCFPVHPPYGPMIPPPGFQAGTFDPYGYPIPINGQYFPNQPDGRGTYLGADGTGTSTSSAEQNDSVNKIILDSSHSMKKGDAGGDQSVSGETNGQTLQDMTDINDALRILLGDAFDPSISDPGELLAMYGAELLKDEELRMEFIYFCEQLLNHEMMMMSQPGCFYPGAYGDFTYPYPIPFNQPAMWPPPGPCPPGWYPNEVAYYYDGESYIPIGPVQLDPQGNPCMVLPLGFLDQYGQPQGAGDYMPIYATPDVTAGNTVSMEQFVQAGGNGIKGQSSFAVY